MVRAPLGAQNITNLQTIRYELSIPELGPILVPSFLSHVSPQCWLSGLIGKAPWQPKTLRGALLVTENCAADRELSRLRQDSSSPQQQWPPLAPALCTHCQADPPFCNGIFFLWGSVFTSSTSCNNSYVWEAAPHCPSSSVVWLARTLWCAKKVAGEFKLDLNHLTYCVHLVMGPKMCACTSQAVPSTPT